jgi:hypothetical protein
MCGQELVHGVGGSTENKPFGWDAGSAAMLAHALPLWRVHCREDRNRFPLSNFRLFIIIYFGSCGLSRCRLLEVSGLHCLDDSLEKVAGRATSGLTKTVAELSRASAKIVDYSSVDTVGGRQDTALQ